MPHGNESQLLSRSAHNLKKNFFMHVLVLTLILNRIFMNKIFCLKLFNDIERVV